MIQTILVTLLLLGMPAGSPEPAREAVPAADTTARAAAQLADRMIEEASRYIGTPYRYGAGGPKAFDCSGFSSFIYREFGYRISHSSKGQAREGRAVEGPLSNLQKGDIAIFGARRNKDDVGHVGIVIDVNGTGTNFRFIHAARGGAMISEPQEEYYRERYLGARRILPDFPGKVAARSEVVYEPDLSVVSVDVAHPDYFDGTLVATVDTLLLSTGDSRVILFGDGTWAYLAKDGTMIAPSSEDRLILDGNGRWRRETPKRIPRQPVTPAVPASVHETRSTAPASAVSEPVTEDPEALYYTIKKGDTLGSIASRYHTSVESLCQLNGINRRTTLHIGHRLRVR